jgi:hypothetical protein
MRPLLGVRLAAFSMGLPMPFGGFPGTRACALKGARPGARGVDLPGFSGEAFTL